MQKETDSVKLSSSEQSTESQDLDGPETNHLNGSQSWTVCSSADDLRFDKFIKIVCEDKLELLIVEGDPPVSALLDAWMKIYTEYNDAIDSDFTAKLEENTYTEVLRAKIKLVGALVEALYLKYNEMNAESLRMLGFNYNFDPSDDERYVKQLNRVITVTKGWVLQVQIKDKEAEENPAAKEVNPKENFTRMIRELSKHMGFPIRAYDYSTYEFAVNFADMQRERSKTQVNGR